MLRAIREICPKYVVGENVSGLISWSGGLVFQEVQADLEAEGYKVFAFVLPAAGVDAPHRRDRVWFVAYSDDARGSTGLGQVQGEDGKVPEWYNNAELSDAGCDGVVAYASGEPSQRVRFEQRNAGESQQGQFGGSCSWMGDGLITDPNSNERSKRRLYEERPEIPKCDFSAYDARYSRRSWEEFPTESPICRGNDGLSARLDGITFSKWRSESLKAYGNAIVPQVAFEIFQAINEFELINKK